MMSELPYLEMCLITQLVSPATGREKKKWTCHQNDSQTVGFDADAPKVSQKELYSVLLAQKMYSQLIIHKKDNIELKLSLIQIR